MKKLGMGVVGIGVLGLGFAHGGGAEAREALTGQCGVDGYSASWAIGSDGNLTMTLAPNGHRRTARFRFFGGDSGSNYAWNYYQYRYGVTATNFGPQSNENVRFGPQRNSPNDPYWSQYNSPDNHNSNVPGPPPIQYMGTYLSPGGNTEIWVRAIFDVPNTPDPSCWTNAIATK